MGHMVAQQQLPDGHRLDDLPEFSLLLDQPQHPAARNLMPIITPFQLLTLPCTSFGCGSLQKRERTLLCCQDSEQEGKRLSYLTCVTQYDHDQLQPASMKAGH